MSHITHLKGDTFPRFAQGEDMLSEIQTSARTFQRPLAEERGDNRVQNKSGESAFNAGHPHSDIRCMANLSHAAATKFEHRMCRIADHLRKTSFGEEVIVAGQPIKANQIGRGTRVQNHHTVIVSIKNGAVLRQEGSKRVSQDFRVLRGVFQGDGRKG